MTTEFYQFPKMARFSRKVIITEKIDGTNACIYIGEDGEFLTGSRTRWIIPNIKGQPQTDNFGFKKTLENDDVPKTMVPQKEEYNIVDMSWMCKPKGAVIEQSKGLREGAPATDGKN